MKAKTKAYLLKELKEKEEEISQLENDRDYWIEECNILRDKLDDLESDLIKPIYNSSEFMYRLDLDGLLTSKLKQFISNYIKFYQEDYK